MLRPVVDDVREHLPNRHAFVDVRQEAIGDLGQPGVDGRPLAVPALAQVIDRPKRFELRLRAVAAALFLKRESPTPCRAELVDEDDSESSLTDDAASLPTDRRRTTIESRLLASVGLLGRRGHEEQDCDRAHRP